MRFYFCAVWSREFWRERERENKFFFLFVYAVGLENEVGEIFFKSF